MGWKKIGTPANSLAIFANRLAALTPDCKRVFMRDPSTFRWKQIGGPARALIGGAWDLYAETPDGKAVYRYDGRDWFKVSDGALQFVGIGNALYKVVHNSRDVYRYDRYENKWTKIGGAAHSVIGGGSKVYASTTNRGEIWEYSRFNDSWTQIGGAGHSWVGIGGTVYGLTPDKKAVYKYNGTPFSWTKVGGPAVQLIGGGSHLYAIQPGTKDVWKYSESGNRWKKIGTPGVGFVASGNRLYGMTTDRKAVYKYSYENKETRRLRKLLYGSFNQEVFGNRIIRGFMIKAFDGKILAQHNADVCFQPLSTLKLLPYFHAVSEIDKGNSDLATTNVDWLQLTTGTADQMNNTNCLQSTDANVTPAEAPLGDVLPTMMWFSHNRSLDAVMEHYGIKNITQRIQNLGLKQTEMYYGCPHMDISVRTWPSNMTTLTDLAKLFEGVEKLDFINKPSSRDIWRTNMIQATPLPGTSYVSPITGANSGAWNTNFLRPLVEEIAGPLKQGFVNEFMQSVSFRKKGGGGGPAGNEIGQCDFRELSLPFKKGSKTVIKRFLTGYYIYQRRDSSKSLVNAEAAKVADFEMEMYRLPITRALATWKLSFRSNIKKRFIVKT